MLILRDILVNLAATFLGDLSSAPTMIGLLISLGVTIYLIISWHRKRHAESKRGMDSWYFIALAMLIAGIAIGAAAYGIGLRSIPVTAAVPSSAPQLARLRIHYTAVSPSPDVIETDNVLKPMSFQFVDDGNQPDPKAGRSAKWTLLILTFDKPVTGENVRVLFEGGDIPYEKKSFTPRNASILFVGPIADKTIQIEVRP